MIRVFGVEETPEYEAANQLREIILDNYPELQDSLANRVTLISSAKCHGQQIRDLDLLLLLQFNSPYSFRPFLSFQNPYDPTQIEQPASVTVQSLCLIIEVKDHPPDRIKFRGTQVEVEYRGDWHNASEQNEAQVYALKNYLAMHNIDAPFIVPLLWLRNVQNTDLPKRPHNILPGNLTWQTLLSVVAQQNPPRYSSQDKKWYMSAGMFSNAGLADTIQLLTKEIEPTRLDRHRMEQINQRIVSRQKNLYELVGSKLLILRGRGGTGKTIRLLQLAKHLYEQQGARILILTYNKALVADLRRLMTLMGVVDQAAHRSIRIQTVHSFFYAVLHHLGIIAAGESDFLEHYDNLKGEAVQLLELDVVHQEDIAQLKQGGRSDFLWDYIFIDEAQDWPDDERRILLCLYPYKVFAIADGVDQLIRSATPAQWRTNLTLQQVEVIGLNRCLRMKAGLTRFVSTFASHLGLPQSDWMANEEIPGGRVVVLEGADHLRNPSLFEDLIAQNADAKNRPVDMLFCMPPNMATPNFSESPAHFFQKIGYDIWDGTLPTVRESYPDTNQLRILQYESCRGLEGWTAVNFELDSFYDYKLQSLYHRLQTSQQITGLPFDEDQIRLLAARWLMIPLTRAMDTLVIHLTGQPSPVREALRAAANQHGEYVEWY